MAIAELTLPRSQPRPSGEAQWYPATCGTCGVSIGQVAEAKATGARPERWSVVRLRKYAIRPWSSDGECVLGPALVWRTRLKAEHSQPVYSLSAHISAHLLEISQAHAIHRFVLDEEATFGSRVLVRSSTSACRVGS